MLNWLFGKKEECELDKEVETKTKDYQVRFNMELASIPDPLVLEDARREQMRFLGDEIEED